MLIAYDSRGFVLGQFDTLLDICMEAMFRGLMVIIVCGIDPHVMHSPEGIWNVSQLFNAIPLEAYFHAPIED